MPEQTGYELLDEILNDIADALREKIGGQTTEEVVTNVSTLNYDILQPKTGFITSAGDCINNLKNKTHKCIMGCGYNVNISDEVLFVFENDNADVQEADIVFDDTNPSNVNFINNGNLSIVMHIYTLYWRGSTGTWKNEVGSAVTILPGETYSNMDMYLYDYSNKFSNTRIVTTPLGDINAQNFSTLIRSI